MVEFNEEEGKNAEFACAESYAWTEFSDKDSIRKSNKSNFSTLVDLGNQKDDSAHLKSDSSTCQRVEGETLP